ncbi:DUF981 family protein [Actinoplanes sp. NBRC 103695]|uniref:DUF981 family protein n=1 Tax=Actinoplanes sp. NBRC 103695 TaxID=3032202 RepID=UPI0024A4EAB0|nr:DUF981 family protein [Actinoplanes sp. NBRC 103695]GLZ00826.1 hypothetical protein Acsp02_80780 [Actinoplanes sp. NBRC 103695]
MIMYNTLIGVAASAALILVPRYWAWLRNERMPMPLVRAPADHTGWAAAFGVLGILLTALGGAMTVTHPLAEARPYNDTIFGGPALLLGVLLLAAAWRISRTTPAFAPDRLPDALGPVGIIVFLLGLVMTWCTLAILRFYVISAAPAEATVTGLLRQHPAIENTFFAVLYGAAALGCLLFPSAALPGSHRSWQILYWAWTVAGIGFALFSAISVYTHAGMFVNLTDGSGYRW